jgi:PRC-barrel domain
MRPSCTGSIVLAILTMQRHLSERQPRRSSPPTCRHSEEPSLHQPVGPEVTNQESAMAMDTKETGSLIGSDKVEGTAVYGANSEKIGTIERVMIDKVSGRVSYAVLGFGGFLGIGHDHYPLPWQSLKYDTRLGGYVTAVTESQLQGAPRYSNDNDWNWGDEARARAVNDYYGLP